MAIFVCLVLHLEHLTGRCPSPNTFTNTFTINCSIFISNNWLLWWMSFRIWSWWCWLLWYASKWKCFCLSWNMVKWNERCWSRSNLRWSFSCLVWIIYLFILYLHTIHNTIDNNGGVLWPNDLTAIFIDTKRIHSSV